MTTIAAARSLRGELAPCIITHLVLGVVERSVRRVGSNSAQGRLRVRQRVGKYRIERLLGTGAFASVYQAMDTIEGSRVALKVPHPTHVNDEVLRDFRTEFRTAARIEHPNVLRVKDASIIDGRLIIALPLGEESLADRLRRRISVGKALVLIEQLLEALAAAHGHRVIHCDIKPENIILFPGPHLRLGDFGIAKVAQKTVRGAGTGTVGFMAPEQAMGRPSFRSDVFSVGLISYRLLTGQWPQWPYAWPPPGYDRLRGRVHPRLIAWLKRSIAPNPRHRYKDGGQALRAFQRLMPTIRRHLERRRRG